MGQAYFPYISPESARHKLMQFINEDPSLKEQLVSAGYSPRKRAFSPAQVAIITSRLGNPWI